MRQLLGGVAIVGVDWATVLAIAFCGIDFAGLLRVFSPDDKETTPDVWYLMAAWLLGATLNAIMTWYAVSIALVENGASSPVLTQETLLKTVPIFVSLLVWLTRILFIGALSMAATAVWAPGVGSGVSAESPAAAVPNRTAATLRPRPPISPAVTGDATLVFVPPRRPVRQGGIGL